MVLDRRIFLGGAGALLGTLGKIDRLGAAEPRDPHKPITRGQWDAIIGGEFSGGFTCVQTTEMTEGPFYYESSLERRSIAEGRPGEPLRLGITLGGLKGPGGRCTPLAGAIIDIWQTDASGLYSNVGLDLQPVDTTGQRFLRGHQLTDDKGYAEFETIVPGWELVAAAPPVLVAKRTTHIHVKAFHERQLITAQLFFPDPLIDMLYADREPYKSHRLLTAPGLDRSYERIRNGEDRFFLESRAQPMTVERVNGVLTAKATIGMMSMGNRGFSSLFR